MSHAVDPLSTRRPRREGELEERGGPSAPGSMPLADDVFRQADELVLGFDAPGTEPSAVVVVVERRSLLVTLRRGLGRGPDIDVIDVWRQHDTFRQRLWRGDRWDLEGRRVRVHNGVLTVRAPMASEVVVRHVAVAPTAEDEDGTGESPARAGNGVSPATVEVEGTAETAP